MLLLISVMRNVMGFAAIALLDLVGPVAYGG